MSAWVGGGSGLPGQPATPTLESMLKNADRLPRTLTQRFRVLVLTVLLGTSMVGLLAHWLALQPGVGFTLHARLDGQVELNAPRGSLARPLDGRVVRGIRADSMGPPGAPTAPWLATDPLVLEHSVRWIVQPAERERYRRIHRALGVLLQPLSAQEGGSLVLDLEGPGDTPIRVEARGWAGIPALFWLLALMGLALSCVGTSVFLAEPRWREGVFTGLAMSQGALLWLEATSFTLGWMRPDWFVGLEEAAHQGLEFVGLACLMQLVVVHPKPLKKAVWFGTAGGVGSLVLLLAWWFGTTAESAWWSWQLLCVLMAVATLGLMTLNQRQSPHPFTVVMRRFTLVSLLSWALLLASMVSAQGRPDLRLGVTTFGVMAWQVFLASQLLLSPYLPRARPVLQEFSLLAASSTVAASLDLLFVSVWALGQFASTALAVFIALGVFLGLRRWVMAQLLGREAITTEQLFERLYRMARELEHQPQRAEVLMRRLMRDLFDPMEAVPVAGEVASASVKGQGGALVVPVPSLAPSAASPPTVLVLKQADKGRRLFTAQDARLVDRIHEQLRRALSFHRAVEQGRSEERSRLAQDLHDDIGARLLTLMYQAPDAAMQDYVRHTLQDLKTLTRGLAVQSHTLLEAAADWKRDLSERTRLARCELKWTLAVDGDVDLSVVQWSALTRILRELASNTLSHSGAQHLSVDLSWRADVLRLCLTDDGSGRAPERWAHGLGLGGVCKRVRQLGGTVVWREASPRGIECEVVVRDFSAPPAAG